MAKQQTKRRGGCSGFGLTAALLLATALCGCGESSRIMVSVGQLPAGATLLQAQVRIGAAQYAATPSFVLSDADLQGDQRYSFGLNLVNRLAGEVAVSVAALSVSSDGSEKRCLLGSATGSLPLSEGSIPTLRLDLTSGPMGCNGDLPLVQQASPQLFAGQVRLAISGFGFAPDSQVLVDGQPQPFVLNPSPLSLLTDLPPTAVTAAGGAQPIQVAVRLASGALSNPVTVSASPPWFDLATAPLYQTASSSGVTIYTGAVTADFNGDKRPDLAVSGYTYSDGKGGGGFVDIFLNSGHGLTAQRLQSPVWSDSATANPADITATAIVASSYRGKPARDLIVAIADSRQPRGGFIVLNNDGQGNFTPTTTRVLDAAYPQTSALAHVDVNPTVDLGMHADLVLMSTASDGSSKLSCFLADGSGNLAMTVYFDAGIGRNASGFVVADLNRDGSPDFATIAASSIDPSRAQLHAILNYRDGKIFPSWADQTTSTSLAGFGGAVVAGDLMGDGTTYLVASSRLLVDRPAASLNVISNRSFLTTHPPHGYATPPNEPALQTLAQLYSAGERPASLALVDADHDAVVDVAALLASGPAQPTRIVVLRSRHPGSDAVDLFPAGPGQLDVPPTLPLWGVSSDALLVADDLNGDSWADLVAVVRGDGPGQKPAAIWFFRSR